MKRTKLINTEGVKLGLQKKINIEKTLILWYEMKFITSMWIILRHIYN